MGKTCAGKYDPPSSNVHRRTLMLTLFCFTQSCSTRLAPPPATFGTATTTFSPLQQSPPLPAPPPPSRSPPQCPSLYPLPPLPPVPPVSPLRPLLHLPRLQLLPRTSRRFHPFILHLPSPDIIQHRQIIQAYIAPPVHSAYWYVIEIAALHCVSFRLTSLKTTGFGQPDPGNDDDHIGGAGEGAKQCS
jgi:hypothetical protein